MQVFPAHVLGLEAVLFPELQALLAEVPALDEKVVFPALSHTEDFLQEHLEQAPPDAGQKGAFHQGLSDIGLKDSGYCNSGPRKWLLFDICP